MHFYLFQPLRGDPNEITWADNDVTNIGSWWHPGFPHTGTRYREQIKMKFDVADNDGIGYQGFVNWNPDFPNYPLCQFKMNTGKIYLLHGIIKSDLN